MHFSEQKKQLLLILILTLLVATSWLPYMQTLFPHLSYGDEGFVVQGAWRVYQGQMPFRDFFAGMPGAYYWTALFFELFGPTFFAVRLGVLVMAILVLLTTSLILRRLGIRSYLAYLMLAAFAIQFGGPYWFIASHHWVALAMTLASLFFLLPQADTSVPSTGHIVLAGVFAAGAALSLQHLGGLWILCAVAAFLGLPRPLRGKYLAGFISGILLIALPIFVYYATNAGLSTLYYDLVTFPLTRYRLIEAHSGIDLSFIGNILDMISSSWTAQGSLLNSLRIAAISTLFIGTLIVYILPIAGVVGLIYLWKTHDKSRRPVLLLLTAFFCAQYLKVLARIMDQTLVFAAPASILILLLVIDQLRQSEMQRKIVRVFAGLWLMVFCSIGAATTGYQMIAPRALTQTPAGPVYSLASADQQTLQRLNHFFTVRQATGEKVFCHPYSPMLYFLFHAQNPTRYDTLVYPMATDEQRTETIKQLEQTKNRWVILTTTVENDPFIRYLEEHYRVGERLPLALIMERTSKP